MKISRPLTSPGLAAPSPEADFHSANLSYLRKHCFLIQVVGDSKQPKTQWVTSHWVKISLRWSPTGS